MSNSLSFLKKNPMFGNFLFASTISLVGNSIFELAIPLYVLQKTHSVVSLSLVSVALHLPHFLTAPLTGFLADHSNKRRLLIGCDIGQIVLLVFVLAFEYSGTSLFWPLLVLIFLIRSLQNLFETVANFQLIPGLVPHADLATANTWFLSFHRLIQIVGPLLGGILMTLFGTEACILVNILTFGATLAFTYGIPDLDRVITGTLGATLGHPALTFSNMFRNFRASLVFIYGSPVFRPFVWMMFLWNLSPLTLNSPSLTYYFNGKYHFSPAEYGMIVSGFGVAGILGFLISDRMYRNYTFADSFYGSCAVQAVLGTVAVVFCPFPIALAVFYSFSRMGSSVLSMGTYILRQTQIPREMAGGVNATLRMFFMSAAPLSALIQGFVMEHFSVETSLALGAASLWGSVWYAGEVAHYFQSRDVSDLTTAPVASLPRIAAHAHSQSANAAPDPLKKVR
jgi:DHA3 family macrolide efflux protein-like MFS transporter